ncbi:hypothetical protein B0T19DRAFT_402107 [Cercophora scortea]|uniref:2EXR domain-containing protein n=1 Tax=Cercophora scortea TaxID=314031 RepID=A0AAE0IFL3_9PEZI|nr:hypothetical protein B0T19DRAFT_402107 [Cercophora scortea]
MAPVTPTRRGDAEKRHRKDMAGSMSPSIISKARRYQNTTTITKAQRRQQNPIFILFPPRSQPASMTTLPQELRDMIWKEAFAPYALPPTKPASSPTQAANNLHTKPTTASKDSPAYATLYTCQPPPLAQVCRDARAYVSSQTQFQPGPGSHKSKSTRYRWEQRTSLPIITSTTNPTTLLQTLQTHDRIILDLRESIESQPWPSTEAFLTTLATHAHDHQILLAVPLRGKTRFYTTTDLALTTLGTKWVTHANAHDTTPRRDRYIRVDDGQALAELRRLVWDRRGKKHLNNLVRGVLGGEQGRKEVIKETMRPFVKGLEGVNKQRERCGEERLRLPVMEVVMQVRMECCDEFRYLLRLTELPGAAPMIPFAGNMMVSEMLQIRVNWAVMIVH